MKKIFWVLVIITITFSINWTATIVRAEGEEIYGVTHFEGTSERKDTASRNMGGVYGPSLNPTSGNPASLGLNKDFYGLWTMSSTNMSNGVKVDGEMTRFLGHFDVYGTNVGFSVGTNRSKSNRFDYGGLTHSGSEDAKVIGLGFQTPIKNLYAGAYFAPEMSTYWTSRGNIPVPPLPGTAPLAMDLKSGVVFGGSYGMLYVLPLGTDRSLSVGVDYRRYRENVWNTTTVGPLPLIGTTIQTTSERSFDSQRYNAGVLYKANRRLSLAVGIYESKFDSVDGLYKLDINKTQYGIDYEVRPDFRVQLGSNGGSFCGGFTYLTSTGKVKNEKDKNLELGFSYQRNAFLKEFPDLQSDSWEASIRLRF